MNECIVAPIINQLSVPNYDIAKFNFITSYIKDYDFFIKRKDTIKSVFSKIFTVIYYIAKFFGSKLDYANKDYIINEFTVYEDFMSHVVPTLSSFMEEVSKNPQLYYGDAQFLDDKLKELVVKINSVDSSTQFKLLTDGDGYYELKLL